MSSSIPDAPTTAFVAVVGAGPAGLFAAETVAAGGHAVTIFDQMPSPGRKLLMAGRGGLNLTHSEDFTRLLSRYGPAQPVLEPALTAFPPAALIDWCHGLGQPTFVGSSGRMFPVALKASPLLRAWLQRLRQLGVTFATRHRWTGFDATGGVLFDTPDGPCHVAPVATILALGGASWPRLGSDGAWTRLLPGVAIAPLRPANCGFRVGWSDVFRARFEGTPVKRIALTFDGVTVRGEAMITAQGIEGGAVYALSAKLRDGIAATGGPATARLDLCPDLTHAKLAARLARPRRAQSLSTFLRKHAVLAPVCVGLVQEALHDGAGSDDLAGLIKAVPVRLLAPAPIERAISSAGGIRLDDLDARFMLHQLPGVFAAGEMLDWEAPTGGYLLQATFSTAAAAASGALAWIKEQSR